MPVDPTRYQALKAHIQAFYRCDPNWRVYDAGERGGKARFCQKLLWYLAVEWLGMSQADVLPFTEITPSTLSRAIAHTRERLARSPKFRLEIATLKSGWHD